MRYFSTFSGIGGFELGIQQAYERLYNSGNNSRKSQAEGELPTEGESVESKDSKVFGNELQPSPVVPPSCIGFSEIDKYAVQIYEKHFNHKNYGDITKIDPRELPDFDLLVGGFPCQAFSIAGKRGGFEDTRGTLFFEIARIVREKQPRLLLLENVKGLLSHDKGRTFYTIISTLDELGYDAEWQVLNSKNHGVPQNRERIFIIGYLRGTPRPQVFPFSQDDSAYLHRKGGAESETKPASAITTREGGRKENNFIVVEGTLDEGTWENRHESIRRVYGTDGISPTVPTGTGGGVMPKITTDAKIRRLTPTECERLQGFPDGWTEGVSDTQRYKTLGNAVTVNVIRDIFLRLL